MSNNPILPIIPNGAGLVGSDDASKGEKDLPVNDDTLDEGETNDSQDAVEQDVREANSVNDNLDK